MIGPGTLVARWRLEAPLGAGGMGHVWLAHALRDPTQKVAVKFVRPDGDEAVAERFAREAAMLSDLKHPNIVKFLSSGHLPAQGLQFVVMEHVPGRTLADLLAQRPLASDEARALFVALADALRYAHERGVSHRDLKPQNVMLRANAQPVLVDFGVALAPGGARLTPQGTLPGTLPWLPPEVFSEARAPDPVRADVYALGLMLHQALTGVERFRGEASDDLSMLAWLAREKASQGPLDPGPAFPDDLREAVRRATEPHPAIRLERMATFAEILGAKPMPAVAPRDPKAGTVWQEVDDPPVPTAQAPSEARSRRAPANAPTPPVFRPDTELTARPTSRPLTLASSATPASTSGRAPEPVRAAEVPVAAPSELGGADGRGGAVPHEATAAPERSGPRPSRRRGVGAAGASSGVGSAPASRPPPEFRPAVSISAAANALPEGGGFDVDPDPEPSISVKVAAVTGPDPRVRWLIAALAVLIGAIGLVLVVLAVLWSGGRAPTPVAEVREPTAAAVDREIVVAVPPDAVLSVGGAAVEAVGGEARLRRPFGPVEIELVRTGSCPDPSNRADPCCAREAVAVDVVPGEGPQVVTLGTPKADARAVRFEVSGAANARVTLAGAPVVGGVVAAVAPGIQPWRAEAGVCPAEAAGCEGAACPDGCVATRGEVEVVCGVGEQVVRVDLPRVDKPPEAAPRPGQPKDPKPKAAPIEPAPPPAPAVLVYEVRTGGKGLDDAVPGAALTSALAAVESGAETCFRSHVSAATSPRRVVVEFEVARSGAVDRASVRIVSSSGNMQTDGCASSAVKSMTVRGLKKGGGAQATFTFQAFTP